MFKLWKDQIQDYWDMQKLAIWVDNEHFAEMPLCPRAGEAYRLVVVDEEDVLYAEHEVFIFEVNDQRVLMEARHYDSVLF